MTASQDKMIIIYTFINPQRPRPIRFQSLWFVSANKDRFFLLFCFLFGG